MANPREQILKTATRLFAAQGYLNTGINQLIAESDVARRTFYHHFPSKEHVAAEYIDDASRRWIVMLQAGTEDRRTASGVVRGIFEVVEQLAKDTKYRGCSMLNMAAEFAQSNSDMRARVKRAKQAQNAWVVERLGAVSISSATARQIDVLLEGSIVSGGAHLDMEPVRNAMNAALALVQKEEGESSSRSGSARKA